MKKLTLLLMLVVMCSSLVFAEDLRLLIEYFSWVNCPHCPYAQDGLRLLEDYLAAQNMSDRYLIIKSMRADGQYNTPQSPGHSERCNLYNNSGVPYTKFQGTNTLSHQDNTQVVYNNAVTLFNSMNTNLSTSPFSMSTVFGISDEGYLTVQSTATIIRTSNYYTTEDTTRAVDFVNSRMFMGVKLNTLDHIWEVMAFDINGQELSDKFESFEVGQTATFNFISTYRPTYPLDMYSAFSFIQRYVQEVNPVTGLLQYSRPEVYQSSMANFANNFVYFSIENPMGYAPFIAHFSSLSFFPAYSSSQLTYAWDFEGNGNYTTNVYPQPYAPQYAYNAPGQYTVSLKITTPTQEEFNYTRDNAITVLAAPTVRELMGEIGTMTLTNDAPWTFIGNATVTYPATLTIENGATIYFNPGVSLGITGHLNVPADEGSTQTTLFTTTEGQTGVWGGISLTRVGTLTHPLVTIKNAIFENAACAVYASYRNILIEDCEFRDNTSMPPYELSPALYLIRVSDAKVNRSVFRNNYRGAIGMETSTVSLKNCLIVNNTGNSSGGLFARFKTTLNIDYCTFYNNRREGSIGGTIFSQGSGSNNVTMNITNTILEGNPPIYFNDPTGKANISYTNYINHEVDPQYPAARFIFGANVLYKEDNIDPNTGFIPMFMNPSAGAGYTFATTATDWILHPNSIVVDKGIPYSSTSELPTYIDEEDPGNPGMALYPARGTIRADLGFYGGRAVPPTSIGDETILKPKNLAVVAYPNPFNPSLNINVGVLNIHDHVNIAVYNVKGQKVKNLHDGLPIGNNFTVVWNGNDENGVSMASGVYFIRVNNETEQDVKKVLLLK